MAINQNKAQNWLIGGPNQVKNAFDHAQNTVDSDQPVHAPSIIRGFALHSYNQPMTVQQVPRSKAKL